MPASDPTHAGWSSLRADHPVFRVHAPVVETDDVAGEPQLRITTTSQLGPHRFDDQLVIGGLTALELEGTVDARFTRALSVLAFIASLSYWKAAIPPEIDVDDLPLEGTSHRVWDRFVRESFGEFCYRNDIREARDAPDAFVRVRGVKTPDRTAVWEGTGPPLVLYSGGKDSLALVEAHRRAGTPFWQFLYNPSPRHLTRAGSTGADRTFTAHRTIDPTLLELNDTGFLNGHTPYSAYLASVATLVATFTGAQSTQAANTRSDDEPNLRWGPWHINHQWTKSVDFEEFFRTQTAAMGLPPYVGAFRPLYELQLLAASDNRSFTSCNRAQARRMTQEWCGRCAKCAWVHLAVAALDGLSAATTLIGSNPLTDPEMASTYREMLGATDARPFECTGTIAEVAACLRQLSSDVPAAADLLADEAEPATVNDLLRSWGHHTLLDASARDAATDVVSVAGRRSRVHS